MNNLPRSHGRSCIEPLLAIADSEGHVTLHTYMSDTVSSLLPRFWHFSRCLQRSLRKQQEITCAESDTLVLSLDWSDRRNSISYTSSPGHASPHNVRGAHTCLHRSLGSLVVSLSNGSLSLLRENDSHELVVQETWHAHDYEPWIAAWNYWDPNIVYSGS